MVVVETAHAERMSLKPAHRPLNLQPRWTLVSTFSTPSHRGPNPPVPTPTKLPVPCSATSAPESEHRQSRCPSRLRYHLHPLIDPATQPPPSETELVAKDVAVPPPNTRAAHTFMNRTLPPLLGVPGSLDGGASPPTPSPCPRT